MSDAFGIHAHATKKLGRRPAPAKPALLFADHLRAAPAHPVVDPVPSLPWPMDFNDQWGDCVVACADHALQAIHAQLTGSYANWSEEQILAYYRTQNPDFDPNSATNGPGSAADGGMVVQDFLSYLVHQGVILGFAKVDFRNEDEMKAATYLGLAIVTGETLTVAQQNQTVWDYVPNDVLWGGHCTCTVGYSSSPDDEDCVSWGQVFPQTQAFVDNQITEAWFVLTQAHVDNPAFRAGFDLASFAAAYSEITGAPFPVPVPPAPTPVPPGPTPAPPPPKPPHHHHRRHHWWDWCSTPPATVLVPLQQGDTPVVAKYVKFIAAALTALVAVVAIVFGANSVVALAVAAAVAPFAVLLSPANAS